MLAAPSGKVPQKRIHPVADLVPDMRPEEYQQLLSSMRMHGYLPNRPIMLSQDGRILDGRHRYKACCELGIQPSWETLDAATSPAAYVAATAVYRRNLTPSQVACVRVALEEQLREELKEQQEQGRRKKPLPAEPEIDDEQILALGNTPESMVCKARKLAQRDPLKFEACIRGETKLHAAYEETLPGFPPETKSKRRRRPSPKPKPKAAPDETPKDQLGNPLPADMVPIFKARDRFGYCRELLREAWRQVEALAQTAAGTYLRHGGVREIRRALDEAGDILKFTRPHAVHGRCRGRGCVETEKEAGCYGSGFVCEGYHRQLQQGEPR